MKGVVPALCGSMSRDRTACEAEIPETRPGRQEGVAVDRIPGQILRHTVWDQLESRCSTSWRTTPTGSLMPVARSELPRLASGARSARHPRTDPPLRLVSTEGNPDTTSRNKQQHTNDEEPERPGQQRRGLARRVVSLPRLAPTLGLQRRGQGRKDARMPRVITVATTALGTVGLGVTRAISAQAHITIGAPRTPGDGHNW
jgi:hypothetical protein